jgi:hypothetical protein
VSALPRCVILDSVVEDSVVEDSVVEDSVVEDSVVEDNTMVFEKSFHVFKVASVIIFVFHSTEKSLIRENDRVVAKQVRWCVRVQQIICHHKFRRIWLCRVQG